MPKVIALFILLASVPLAYADPLDLRQIPAAATWIVHLDLDSANQSVLGKGVRQTVLAEPRLIRALDKVRDSLGIDPTSDIHDLTLFGVTFAPDSCVLAVHGKVDRPRLLALLSKAPSYRVEPIHGYDVYFWHEPVPPDAPAGGNSGRTNVGAFFGSDRVVIGAHSRKWLMPWKFLTENPQVCRKIRPWQFPRRRGRSCKRLPLDWPRPRDCRFSRRCCGNVNRDRLSSAKTRARRLSTLA